MIFEICIIVLCCASVANIITSEYVFKWFREWLVKKTKTEWVITLFHCPTCLGFWIGLFVGLILIPEWSIPIALITSLVGKVIKSLEE